jgi:hypothetical protein
VFENSREREIGMGHGGITGFEVKIGRDGGISEPGTGSSYQCSGIASNGITIACYATALPIEFFIFSLLH